MRKNSKKVLVGLSGGLDSTVTAFLLKEQGYDVIGIHLNFWTDPLVKDDKGGSMPQNKCCTIDGIMRVRQIAHQMGVPFYVLNFEETFKERVVDYFLDGYAKAETPNPCIECNRHIKFGFFFEKMKELGADYIATGHYAKIIKNGRSFEMHLPKDMNKDQTYFLYTLNQDKLKHVLFPLGDLTKEEVRKLAKKYGIHEVEKQKESQNICFFPEKTPKQFLNRHLNKKIVHNGPILTVEGKKIGSHHGLINYTLGQRKGLGIGGIKGYEHLEGEGWYVVKLDKEQNAVIVGRENDLYKEKLRATNLSFTGKAPKSGIKIKAKIRSRFPAQPATLEIKDNKAVVTFEKKQRAITPGQSVVFYDGDKVLGGGIII
ncbi:tRNA 2-thiouridine(34) synthase MnmA [Candidatus Peregrinibacteria bacterium]|nr:tRNA 2-thiouridine(34) synthase MnmA [Candidatus Peregrinibacteria bacterium]